MHIQTCLLQGGDFPDYLKIYVSKTFKSLNIFTKVYHAKIVVLKTGKKATVQYLEWYIEDFKVREKMQIIMEKIHQKGDRLLVWGSK